MVMDIRTLNPNQLTSTSGDGASVTTSSDTTSAAPEAARLTSLRSLLATDGVASGTPTSAGQTAGLPLGSAPSLPNPVGATATPPAAAKLLTNTTMFDTNLAAPISAAEAFNILQKSAMTGYALSSVINRVANMTAIDAKKSEAKHLEQQVQGEREHALNAFVFSVGAAVATVGVPVYGSNMARGKPAGEPAGGTPAPAAGSPGAPGATGSAAANTLDTTKSSTEAAKNAQNAKKTTETNKLGSNDKARDTSSDIDAAATARTKERMQQARTTAHSGQPGPSTATLTPQSATQSPKTQASDGATPVTAETRNVKTQEADEKRVNMGNALTQAGPSVGGVITAGGDLYDKTSATGGQYQADQAKIAQKQDAIDAQVAELGKDSSKSSQEQALEVLKAAQQLTQSFSQRWAEVNNNIANR